MHKLREILKLLADSGKELGKNRPLILASSTAFFTIFSIPPTLIILANALSIYFKQENLTAKFSETIADLFGQDVSTQLLAIADNFRNMASEPWITYAGFIFLIFVATNLFKVIRMSVNQIWNVRMEKQGGLLFRLRKRVISLGIILLTGVFFIFSTIADSAIAFVENAITDNLFAVNTVLIVIASKLASIIFISLWFTAIFRFLPDAKINWRSILTGAVLTSVLFTIGKYLLERFLINSNIDSIFDTSTSIVLVMLFIFYSSFIVYYGASFIYVYHNSRDKKVKPRKNAEQYKVTSVDN